MYRPRAPDPLPWPAETRVAFGVAALLALATAALRFDRREPRRTAVGTVAWVALAVGLSLLVLVMPG